MISVVIDNYNYGRFLPEALESALAQDLPAGSFEVVVVDDGSTDDSRRVLERYQGRVRAVFQENRGYGTALSRGVAEAKGDIVSFLDSDDVWRPDKLRRVLERFDREPESSAVQHALQDTDAALEPLPVTPAAWPERYRLDDFLDGLLEFGATSGMSFRRSAIEKALPVPPPLRFLYADHYFLVHALLSGPVGNIREPLGSHRVHGGNFCAGTLADPKKLEADLEQHAVYRGKVEAWLAERGRALSPRYRKLEALETLRREILLDSYRGRRLGALGRWSRGLVEHGGESFALFRLATCLLAVVSPGVYLGAHRLYSGSDRLRGWRRKVAPA